MADELEYTDNGDGTVTLTNDPVPTEITIPRVPWEHMVEGVFPGATVTQDEDNNTQHLVIGATNVNAAFDREATLPGRVTLLSVTSWVEV